MKKKIFLMLCVVIIFSCINLVVAENLAFDFLIKGDWELIYNDFDFEFTFGEDMFSDYPEITSKNIHINLDFIRLDDFGDEVIGEGPLKIHLLDSKMNIISEKKRAPDFRRLTNPESFMNITSTSVSFNDNPNATHIRVYYEDKLFIEQEFRSKLCNNNGKCENKFIGYNDMFENSISCSSDCDSFSIDGICGVAEDEYYSFNDEKCDWDCTHDSDPDDEYGAECFKEELNVKCTDFDFGAGFSDSSFINSKVFYKQELYYDECVNENTVREYYCGRPWYFFGSQVLKSANRQCKYGCEYGACLNESKLIEEEPEKPESGLDLPPEPGEPTPL